MQSELSRTGAFRHRRSGQPKFRALQIWQWIWRKNVADFEAMTDVSRETRALLTERATLSRPEVAVVRQSSDGTVKFLLRLADGEHVETVLIPSDAPPRPGDRAGRMTQCLSTQVGLRHGLYLLQHRRPGLYPQHEHWAKSWASCRRPEPGWATTCPSAPLSATWSIWAWANLCSTGPRSCARCKPCTIRAGSTFPPAESPYPPAASNTACVSWVKAGLAISGRVSACPHPGTARPPHAQGRPLAAGLVKLVTAPAGLPA